MSYITSKQELEKKLTELYSNWIKIKEPVRGTNEWFRWKADKLKIRTMKRKLDKFKTYEELSNNELNDLFNIEN